MRKPKSSTDTKKRNKKKDHRERPDRPERMEAQKCRLRGLSGTEYGLLLEMCRQANSLANSAEWHIRHFRDRTGSCPSYEKNNQISKKNVNHRMLQANCARQILKRQDASISPSMLC